MLSRKSSVSEMDDESSSSWFVWEGVGGSCVDMIEIEEDWASLFLVGIIISMTHAQVWRMWVVR